MSFSNFISSKSDLSPSSGLTKWVIRLAVISAAVTMAIMILASSIIQGFQQKIEEKIFGFWGHVVVTNAAMTSQYESTPMKVNDAMIDDILNVAEVSMELKNGEMVTSKGGVRLVQSTALLPGIIYAENLLEGIILKGIDRDFDPAFFTNYMKTGQPLVISDSISNAASISEQTAQRLGLSVGDDLSLLFVIKNKQYPRRFEITSIYRTGLEEYDRKFILVDIKRIRQLLKWEHDEVGALEVFVEDVSDAPLISDYIYYEILENDEYAESIKDKYPGIFEWLELQRINEWVILGLMLLVCLLNMMTTLLILILEKTNMIGILKSLGARNRDIRSIFIRHGVRILGRGLLWGNLIGIGVALLQDKLELIPMNESDYYLSTVPIELNIPFIIGLNVCTVVLVILSLWIPSNMISRIDPVKAIRFS